MALENFIIQLNDHCTQRQIELVTRKITQWQGKIMARFPDQSTVIVTIDSSMRERIEAIPGVELVGGVQIQPQSVRRIRIRQSGIV